MSYRVCLVVVNFASIDLITANLAGVGGLGGVAEVVVVDNLSTAAERSRVLEAGAAYGWRVVETSSNLGFGAGVDLGVVEALGIGAEVICLLNPDARIEAADLLVSADRAAADPRSLRSPRVVTEDGRDWSTGGRLDLRTGTTPRAVPGTAPDWLSGACLIFHAEAWGLTGGFDPDYFLYWEDVDLSWRHRRAGGHLAYDGDLTVVHTVGGSQRNDHRLGRGRSAVYYFYNCRNRLLFAAKHLDRRTRWRWALTAPVFGRAVLLRGGRRQLLRPWTPVSAIVRGTWAGLRMARSVRRDSVQIHAEAPS